MYAYYNGNSWGLEDTQRSSPLNDTPGYAGADPWFLNRGKAEYWGAAEADCQCQAPRVGRWGLGRGLPLQWGMVWGPTAWKGPVITFSAGARVLEQGGHHGQFWGAHGERVEHEPLTAWGLGAEPPAESRGRARRAGTIFQQGGQGQKSPVWH